MQRFITPFSYSESVTGKVCLCALLKTGNGENSMPSASWSLYSVLLHFISFRFSN